MILVALSLQSGSDAPAATIAPIASADGVGESLIYTGQMMKIDDNRMRYYKMQERTGQSKAEYATMLAERDALIERKKAAWWAGNSAEYMRLLGRIAEIETRLQDGGT